MGLKEKRQVGTDWMHLAQDGDHWWALVRMVMNLGFQKGG